MPDAFPLPKFEAEVERTLDNGLRLVVPPDWREYGIPEFFLVCDSSNSYIKAFPPAEVDKIVAKIEQTYADDLERMHEELEALASVAKRVKVDAAGRLAIPSEYLTAIGLDPKKSKDVTLRGAFRTFNIWNPAKLAEREGARKALEASGKPQVNGRKSFGV